MLLMVKEDEITLQLETSELITAGWVALVAWHAEVNQANLL